MSAAARSPPVPFLSRFTVLGPPTTPNEIDSDAFDELVRREDDSAVFEPFRVNDVSYLLRHPTHPLSEQAISNFVEEKLLNCRTCRERSITFSRLSGPNGPIFYENLYKATKGPDNPLGATKEGNILKTVRGCCVATCKEEPTGIFLIGQPTPFGTRVLGKNKYTGMPFEHLHLRPSSVCDEEKLLAIKGLNHMDYTSIDTRINKLLGPKEKTSIGLIEEAVEKLVRPDHWKTVLKWVKDLQTFMDGLQETPTRFENLSSVDKWKVRVFALTTGNIRKSGNGNQRTHNSYFQSSNLVDFMALENVTKIAEEMDKRTDPRNYMVSEYNRALAEKKVTSDCTIGLLWETSDDLDIHVGNPEGSSDEFHCYFSDMEAGGCKLDFDAGVKGNEEHPAENVSVPPNKTVAFWVEVYKRRTKGNIPYTIIIREKGKDDLLIRCCTDGRAEGLSYFTNTNKGEHSFGSATVQDPQISESRMKKIMVHNDHWVRYFGIPTSSIASIKDCQRFLIGTPSDVTQSTNDRFMGMLEGMSLTTKQPSSLSQLAEMFDGSGLSVKGRDYAPGYLSVVQTLTPCVGRHLTTTDSEDQTMFISACGYHAPGELPSTPQFSGTVRISDEWVNSHGDCDRLRVDGIYKIGGKFFLKLRNMKIPRNAVLGGGFYPTDLKSEHHKVRDRWAFCHHDVTPNNVDYGDSDVSHSMVGAFPVSDTCAVYWKGERIQLDTQ